MSASNRSSQSSALAQYMLSQPNQHTTLYQAVAYFSTAFLSQAWPSPDELGKQRDASDGVIKWLIKWQGLRRGQGLICIGAHLPTSAHNCMHWGNTASLSRSPSGSSTSHPSCLNHNSACCMSRCSGVSGAAGTRPVGPVAAGVPCSCCLNHFSCSSCKRLSRVDTSALYLAAQWQTSLQYLMSYSAAIHVGNAVGHEPLVSVHQSDYPVVCSNSRFTPLLCV